VRAPLSAPARSVERLPRAQGQPPRRRRRLTPSTPSPFRLRQVRAFLSAPARSVKGLPRRPVVGTAISIQLDLSAAQVAEWFGAGYE
jgi:hypothetical protein